VVDEFVFSDDVEFDQIDDNHNVFIRVTALTSLVLMPIVINAI
jgi:hypothetical protein